MPLSFSFFYNVSTSTAIYTLSLHDALPIYFGILAAGIGYLLMKQAGPYFAARSIEIRKGIEERSEEHTSELQSLRHLVCRLLLEKKNSPAPQPRKRGARTEALPWGTRRRAE